MKRNCCRSSVLPQLKMYLNYYYTITYDGNRHLSTSHDVPKSETPWLSATVTTESSLRAEPALGQV